VNQEIAKNWSEVTKEDPTGEYLLQNCFIDAKTIVELTSDASLNKTHETLINLAFIIMQINSCRGP